MKLTSNQRKYLESLANHLDPLVRVGKQGLEAKIVSSLNEVFSSHELVKIKILDSAPVEAGEVAEEMVRSTGAALVRVIGRVVILYRPFTEKPCKIELPAPR